DPGPRLPGAVGARPLQVARAEDAGDPHLVAGGDVAHALPARDRLPTRPQAPDLGPGVHDAGDARIDLDFLSVVERDGEGGSLGDDLDVAPGAVREAHLGAGGRGQEAARPAQGARRSTEGAE